MAIKTAVSEAAEIQKKKPRGPAMKVDWIEAEISYVVKWGANGPLGRGATNAPVSAKVAPWTAEPLAPHTAEARGRRFTDRPHDGLGKVSVIERCAMPVRRSWRGMTAWWKDLPPWGL